MISQFREWIFINLIIENDNNDENEKELMIENQLKLKKDEFLLINSSIKNELMISNINQDNINHYYNLLINNKWLSIII